MGCLHDEPLKMRSRGVHVTNVSDSTQDPFIEHQIASNAKSTSQPAFGMNKVRDLLMLNPPLVLQREFATFVAKVDKLAFAARRRRDVAKQLYRAKIQEFFG